jgi:hypothetical protein
MVFSFINRMTAYLDGSTLELPLQGIADSDIDLRSVELSTSHQSIPLTQGHGARLTAPSPSLSFQLPGKTRSNTVFNCASALSQTPISPINLFGFRVDKPTL